MMSHDEEIFNKAILLKSKGKLDDAVKLFEAFGLMNPDSTLHLVPLAEILLEQGLNEQARVRLQRHTQMKPASWISSVGLYHCLLCLDRITDAIEEASRFQSVFEDNRHAFSENAIVEILGYLEEAQELRTVLEASS